MIRRLAIALGVGAAVFVLAVKSHGEALDPNGNRVIAKFSDQHSLIAIINAKLRRWVHPTGKCGAGRETLATYYWQGKRVATGARFDPHGMTAASRTLPFGTVLAITNPHNSRSVRVTINDRGPYTIAELDLALGAAQALGLRQSSYLCVVRE